MTAAPIRLLLLEDDPGDAQLVRAALAEDGLGEFSVICVARLADALARIQTERIDAVLCDLGVPDSTGIATAQAIIARVPALPLVVLTGSSDEELGRVAIRRGAQDYLVKGKASWPMISRTLRYAIERKRLEAELRDANEALERRVAERTADLDIALTRLNESLSSARALAETSTDAIITADREGTILGWNRAAERMFGYARSEALGQPFTLVIPGRYRGGHLAGVQRILAGGERHVGGRTMEFHGLTKAGAEIPIELSVSTWKTSQGRMFAGIIRDISERKRAEREVREHESRFIATFEQAAVGIAHLSPDGHYLRVNRRLCAITGYSREELLARCFQDITHPDDLEADLDFGRQLLAGEIPAYSMEKRYLHKNGETVWINLTIALVRKDSGEPDYFISMTEDISARKRAEEAQRAAEEQFRGLVEQSIAGIYIIQDGRLAYVNPRCAEILAYGSAKELIGREPLSLVAEKDRAMVAENMRRRFEGEACSVSYSLTALCKDGLPVEVGVHGTLATYRGRPAIIGLMQDISEKKRAEEEIQRYVEQLRNAFMRTVQVATTLSELRDPYAAGHERRVAEIAAAIGAELGFDARRQEGLRVAGYLHDIGKITVPTEILSKPGKLSPIEFKLIQGHPQAGYDVLKDAEFPWPVAEVALQHHERMDGSGYPCGLHGEAILPEARVVAVADVVEAMSSHRPYRAARGIEAALAEIERGRGTAYDPSVANACLRLFREKDYMISA